jgi:hypothetical protein
MSGNTVARARFPFFFLLGAPLLQRQLATISREQAPVQGVKEKKKKNHTSLSNMLWSARSLA